MNFILFDSNSRENLLPLTFTRPVADIRIGISTLREKWELLLDTKTSSHTEDYLGEKYPIKIESDNIYINASAIPSLGLVEDIKGLKINSLLIFEEELIAVRTAEVEDFKTFDQSTFDIISSKLDIDFIANTWDIFSKNDKYLREDFEVLTKNRISAAISETNFIRGDRGQIFIEEGAVVEFAYLNAETGPIYIAKDAEVMEGSKIRGPFALCEHSALKMDAKIYGATTIGPHCKVGGEVNNVVFFGYANKGHDGFLGNAVIGEWCNLGADTNNSNLKNTYEEVKLWNYGSRHFMKTGLQFCGLIMGDHSKSGINTMFNTGTVVGVSCNIYGSGFQRNFIPSFSWGSPAGMKIYNLKKSFKVADAVLNRRSKVFDEMEEKIFAHIHNLEQE